MIKWKSRYENPPKEGDDCLVVDRWYSEIYFDTATTYDDGEIRFTDKGDEFYILESEIITSLDYEKLKSKAKPY